MVLKNVFCPTQTYRTRTGIGIHRTLEEIPVEGAIRPLVEALDQRRGVLLTSAYEYPGRYTRWDIGFIDPPLCLECRGREFHFSALNRRGRLLLSMTAAAIRGASFVVESELSEYALHGIVATPSERFTE